MEVISGEPDSETNPGHIELLAIVNCLSEDDIVFIHRNLVHLPAQLRRGVRGFTGAV